MGTHQKCVKSDLPCLIGLRMSCRTLVDLSKELWPSGEQTGDPSFLLTSRLNQDALENTFSFVRGKGGHRCNPDATEFRQALAQTMVDSFLLQPKDSNCQEDLDKFLFDLGSLQEEGKS